MKTAKDILLENIPKDCWWDEMENLTNTPVEYVTNAMESFAAQSVREYKEKLKNEVMSMRMNRHPVTAQVTIQVVVELIDSIDLPSPPTNKG